MAESVDKTLSYDSPRPRYMGRRRSLPGDPPRIRELRERFADASLSQGELVQIRRALCDALAIVDRAFIR